MPKKATRGGAMKGLREIPAGSGNWFWYAYDKSRQPKRKSVALRAVTQDAAVDEASALRSAWARGEFDPWADAHEPGKTLREYVDEYLRAYSSQAPNTIRNKRSHLNGFLASCPARLPSGVTERHVEAYALAKPNESTRTRRLAVLRQFFDYLAERRVAVGGGRPGDRDANPARRVAADRKRRMSKRDRNESARRRDRFFTPDDVRRLAETARTDLAVRPKGLDSLAYLAAAVEFAACTGLRREELVHLGWGDVRLSVVGPAGADGGVVTVRNWGATDGRGRVAESFSTKNGRDRVVPLCPRAAAVVRDAEDRRETDDPFEPVFKRPTVNGRTRAADVGWRRRRLATTAFNDHFGAVRDACGLGSPPSETRRTGDAVWHTLRHTYVSWMVMLGVPPELLRRWTGPRSTSVFAGYVHMTEGYLAGRTREVQRELAAYLCPGAHDDALEAVFPESASAVAAAWGGAAIRPHVPAEEAVFGGLLYAPVGAPS